MTQGIVIAIEGSLLAVRVVPHKTDITKLVLKSIHPEAGAAFCKLSGLTHSDVWRGSNYFMLTVEKAAFLAKASSMITAAVEAMVGAYEPPKALPIPKCPECGTDDGLHFNYCPYGKQTDIN